LSFKLNWRSTYLAYSVPHCSWTPCYRIWSKISTVSYSGSSSNSHWYVRFPTIDKRSRFLHKRKQWMGAYNVHDNQCKLSLQTTCVILLKTARCIFFLSVASQLAAA